ncbi:NAD-dependent epimerase/dehydratase family protein [Niabella sp. CJ426]|uniref:NAD-dependent epimerase/dehydratase family protein n=1 Tax=Niabella sp. CJ426 TaxID=3393740 RepID=UPI003CFE9042
MKVLVTGATGFIGNYVINELLERNHTVVATSLNKDKAAQASWFSQVTYIPFNINNIAEDINLFHFFQQPECIIHLAWEGLPNYKSDHHIKQNLPLHRLFLKNLVSGGAANINITGTCFEYGMQEGCLSEDMPAQPSNYYAIAKNQLRLFAEELTYQHSYDLKWLRLFYMFGKRQAENSLIPQLEKALRKNEKSFNMSGGEQVRDFLPIELVAKYIVEASLQTELTGIVNICSSQPITVKDLVLQYLEDTKQKIHLNLGYYPYPDFEPMHFWGCNQKLLQILAADNPE